LQPATFCEEELFTEKEARPGVRIAPKPEEEKVSIGLRFSV